MEGSKYYKPEMEEIHPGFECEVMDNTHFKHIKFPEGLKDIQELKQYQDDMMKMAHADARVKHLDREDIESLGWNFEKQYPGLNEFCFKLGEYFLDYDLDSYYLRIYWGGEGDVTRFSGTVKNKSELCKLMSMLGIANSDKNT